MKLDVTRISDKPVAGPQTLVALSYKKKKKINKKNSNLFSTSHFLTGVYGPRWRYSLVKINNTLEIILKNSLIKRWIIF